MAYATHCPVRRRSDEPIIKGGLRIGTEDGSVLVQCLWAVFVLPFAGRKLSQTTQRGMVDSRWASLRNSKCSCSGPTNIHCSVSRSTGANLISKVHRILSIVIATIKIIKPVQECVPKVGGFKSNLEGMRKGEETRERKYIPRERRMLHQLWE